MSKSFFIVPLLLLMLIACNSHTGEPDASGSFEADEVVVSSEIGGKLLSFNIDEGGHVEKIA